MSSLPSCSTTVATILLSASNSDVSLMVYQARIASIPPEWIAGRSEKQQCPLRFDNSSVFFSVLQTAGTAMCKDVQLKHQAVLHA